MTPAGKAAFTSGPACASGEVRDINGHLLWGGDVQPILPRGEYRGPIASVLSCAHIDGISNDEAEANAEFIAEAFTVAHETGLTPRQLAERCKELEAALRELKPALLADHGFKGGLSVDSRRRAADIVSAAIAKTGGAA